MTDELAAGDDLAERMARLEATFGSTAAALEGHGAWLADLQSGLGDAVTAARGELDAHTTWLDALEGWMRSTVRVLANFGAQPLAGG
ncbi:MAG: hypothetical protein QOE63_1304, partial [Acidimicrobiaceae bacterium]